MEIVLSRSPYKQKRVRISAYTIEGLAGQIDYLNNPDRPFAHVGLLDVSERFQGLGIGTTLLQALATDLGPKRIIQASVIHDPTFAHLEGLNPRLEAYVNLSHTFSHRDVLKEIPIVRIFESGGIHILRMRVNYNSQTRRLDTGRSVNTATLRGFVL